MKSSVLFLVFLAVHNFNIAQTNGQMPSVAERLSVADEYCRKGENALYYVRLDSAHFNLKKALGLYEEALPSQDDDAPWDKITACWDGLGEIHRQKTDFDSANSCYQKALEVGLAHLGENHVAIATCYHHLGLLYSNLADANTSRIYCEKALSIRRKLFGEKHLDVAESMTLLGKLDFAQDKIEDGERRILEAHKMRLELVGENDLRVAGSYLSLLSVYARRDDAKYLDYGQKALNLCLKMIGEMHPIAISAYNALALYCYFKEDNFGARDYLLKNERLISIIYGENAFQLIANNTNLAAVFCALKDFNRSIEYHRKVQKILKERYGENIVYANSLCYLGEVYALKGDYQQAVDWYDKSYDLNVKLGVPAPWQFMLLNDLEAVLYLKIKDYINALKFSQKLLSLNYPKFNEKDVRGFPDDEKMIVDELLVDAFSFRGIIFRNYFYSRSQSIPDLQLSLKNFKTAVLLIDKLQMDYTQEISRIQMGTKINEVCSGALETTWQLYQLDHGQQQKETLHYFMEKEKSAALSFAIQDEEAKQTAGIPDSLLQASNARRERLAQLKTDIQKEATKLAERDSVKSIELQNDYFNESRAYELLIKKFEKEFPRYHNLKYNVSVPSIIQIQTCLDDWTAMIEYFVADSLLYSVCISRSDCNIVTVSIDSTFSVLCDEFLSAIKADRPQRVDQIGGELYKKLILPHEEKLADKTNLVIIQHSCLAKIPFEALQIPVAAFDRAHPLISRYLVEQFAISYHLSANIYLTSLQRHEQQAETAAGDGFIGFAPVFVKNHIGSRISKKSVFDSYLASIGNYYSMITRDGENFCELPFSRKEVQGIADEFRRKKEKFINYFDQSATEEMFKQDVQHGKYVHLATHSFINEQEPILSGIAFYQPADGAAQREDGVLYAEEVYGLNLNADLVVLSSCESGIGKQVKGEGMLGFTRGFLYAGARNILVSLWKVDDRQTSELMVSFYRQVLNGKSFADALQNAKTTMLKKDKRLTPLHWSGFILIGQ